MNQKKKPKITFYLLKTEVNLILALPWSKDGRDEMPTTGTNDPPDSGAKLDVEEPDEIDELLSEVNIMLEETSGPEKASEDPVTNEDTPTSVVETSDAVNDQPDVTADPIQPSTSNETDKVWQLYQSLSFGFLLHSCPGTSAPSTTRMTMFLYLWSSDSKAWGEVKVS